MSIHSRNTITGRGKVRISADVRDGLMSARQALALLREGGNSRKAATLLRHLDAAANAYVAMLRTLHDVSYKLRAGADPRRIAHEIEDVLELAAPASPRADGTIPDVAGEGEI